MSDVDVAVVGAGPSGAATALLLARAGHSVAILDRARFPRDKACGEGLMPPGVAVLRRLGLLDRVLEAGARRIDGVCYSDSDARSACASFPTPPHGGEAWALGVRRTSFDAQLVNALREETRVVLHEGTTVTGLVSRGDRVAGVRTESGVVSARVVVGADGLHSRVRRWAGLHGSTASRGARYGIAGHWRVDTRDVQSIAVRFAAGHEWYTAPVEKNTLLVSVLGGRRIVGDIARRYPAAARAAVPALRTAEPIGQPLAAGIFQQRVRSVARNGVFLVGDAAGYEDAATGEGLAIGLELAERAAAHVGAILRDAVSDAAGERAYRHDHAALWRDRRRLIRLALMMAAHPRLSSRAIARAATEPRALAKLLAINCGYIGFGDLKVRDWMLLAGI